MSGHHSIVRTTTTRILLSLSSCVIHLSIPCICLAGRTLIPSSRPHLFGDWIHHYVHCPKRARPPTPFWYVRTFRDTKQCIQWPPPSMILKPRPVAHWDSLPGRDVQMDSRGKETAEYLNAVRALSWAGGELAECRTYNSKYKYSADGIS
jgi:hypothetical protein